jgi:IS4 transposase
MPGTADSTLDLFQDPTFIRFAGARPVAVLAPLALRHLLNPQALQQVFQENAHAQREVAVPFSALTRMMATVVLGQEPSVNSAIKKMSAELVASHPAVYGNLQRLEPGIARGLVTYSAQRTLAFQKHLGGIRRHDLAGYETRILDGNHLAGTDHRLRETRNTTAAPLPGKALVVYGPRHDAIRDCIPIEDGHAQERSALDPVLDTVRAGHLWVADRNFCTLKFLYGIAAADAAFLIRQHGQVKGEPLGQPRAAGTTETGVVYEQKFRLPDHRGVSLVIRRITVTLRHPTRDGDRQIHVLTNLPRDVDAVALAEEYRTRWRIETVMHVLTEAFRCEIKPLCYPRAALFGFAIAGVMYNARSMVRAAIRAEHGRETEESLSRYCMAAEIAQASDGLLVARPASAWESAAGLTPERLSDEMRPIARGMNFTRYRKSPRGPRKPKPKPTHAKRKVHVSTKKLLDQRRE